MSWIKIDTDIVDHWIWQDAEKLKWWLDILIMASWKERKQLVGTQLVSLHRGQFVASLSYLCKRWNRSRTMVENYLRILQEGGMISRVCENNIAIIEVTNYEHYQDKKDADKKAYLEEHQTDCKSARYDTEQVAQKAYHDAHLDASEKADLEAYPSATREESIDNNIYNNIKELSLHSSSSSVCKPTQNSDPIDYKKFSEFFNNEIDNNRSVIPKVKAISEKRKKMIWARIREHGKNSLADVVGQATSSDFLNGKNDRGWVADIDWMLRPNNYVKILEGNYKNLNNGTNQRRATEVQVANPEDYGGSF